MLIYYSYPLSSIAILSSISSPLLYFTWSAFHYEQFLELLFGVLFFGCSFWSILLLFRRIHHKSLSGDGESATPRQQSQVAAAKASTYPSARPNNHKLDLLRHFCNLLCRSCYNRDGESWTTGSRWATVSAGRVFRRHVSRGKSNPIPISHQLSI